MARHKKFHDNFLSGVISPKIKEKEKIIISNHQIICVTPKSRGPLKDLVSKIIERSGSDLGEAPPLPRKWKCYIEIKEKHAIGYLLVENNVIAHLTSGSINNCPIGVLRMWVVTKERRHGVCTALMDAARNNEDDPVPYCNVAFSDPTEDGLAFATSYCGTEPFVYHIVL